MEDKKLLNNYHVYINNDLDSFQGSGEAFGDPPTCMATLGSKMPVEKVLPLQDASQASLPRPYSKGCGSYILEPPENYDMFQWRVIFGVPQTDWGPLSPGQHDGKTVPKVRLIPKLKVEWHQMIQWRLRQKVECPHRETRRLERPRGTWHQTRVDTIRSVYSTPRRIRRIKRSMFGMMVFS